LRLPFDFDPARLRGELSEIAPGDWVSHYNQSDFEGNWSGVALRSSNGSTSDLVVRAGDYADTPLLARCAYIRGLMSRFPFVMTSVRLLRLHSGSLIKEHCDPALGFEDGEIRLHIPIQTSPQVYFYLDGRRVVLEEGQTWYLDLSRRHRIVNQSPADRIHLVIDGMVNDWVRETFGAAIAAAGGIELPPIAITAFDRFRELVFHDTELQQRLLAVADRAEFVTLAIQLGRDHGYLFDGDLVESAIRRGRQDWNHRWETA
jgi:hypothetical protein